MRTIVDIVVLIGCTGKVLRRAQRGLTPILARNAGAYDRVMGCDKKPLR
jgi:hypothetical protein